LLQIIVDEVKDFIVKKSKMKKNKNKIIKDIFKRICICNYSESLLLFVILISILKRNKKENEKLCFIVNFRYLSIKKE
jgi:hypothetical protein